jgi:hypothetical protein
MENISGVSPNASTDDFEIVVQTHAVYICNVLKLVERIHLASLVVSTASLWNTSEWPKMLVLSADGVLLPLHGLRLRNSNRWMTSR